MRSRPREFVEDAFQAARSALGRSPEPVLGGTGDPAWLPGRAEGSRARLVTVEDADHAVEVPSWESSMEIQRDIVSAAVDHARWTIRE